MKVTVDISDEEIMEEAKRLITEKIAERIRGEYMNSERYCYRNVIKECVREAIKQDIDNLSDRAVMAASKSIENRAVKKLLSKLEDK